jgi:hypothetical protein
MQPGKHGGSLRAICESGTRPLGLVWQAELVLRSRKRSNTDENGTEVSFPYDWEIRRRGGIEAPIGEGEVTDNRPLFWERLHYDWSDPNRVVLATTDSNVWGGASGHTYTFTRQPNGTTEIDVVVVREGKNLKGRLLGFVVGTIGRRVLEKAFENSVKAIEARNSTARAARAAGAS